MGVGHIQGVVVLAVGDDGVHFKRRGLCAVGGADGFDVQWAGLVECKVAEPQIDHLGHRLKALVAHGQAVEFQALNLQIGFGAEKGRCVGVDT